MTNALTAELVDETIKFIPDLTSGPRPQVRPWQKWLDAELGLRDYWYPMEASRNLKEGEHRVLMTLGEEILLLRHKGRVYAIENRCCHRGARLSVKPMCLSDDTITCWVHTFTYGLEDGVIRTIMNNPNSKLIGRPGIKSYPVQEVKGLIFVFIGDIAPPPLAEDVPPGFLDEDIAIYVADPQVVQANWRLGCEGAFDPAHHFIHNWSRFSLYNRLPLSFGWVANPEKLKEVTTYEVKENGPRGFTRAGADTVVDFAAEIPSRDGKTSTTYTLPMAKARSAQEIQALKETSYEVDVGLWLPCTTKIDPWPFPGILTGECFVPIDEFSHRYIQYGWKRVTNEQEREEWESGELSELLWKDPTVDGFTNDDITAREALAKFYAEEDGFDRETLMAPDVELLMWRMFASQNARGGVQELKHKQGRFVKNPG